MKVQPEFLYPAQLRRARWATRGQFAALGVLSGAWGAHIPSVKAAYVLHDGQVALVLLAGALGAVLSLLWAGRTVARLGVRSSCALAGCGLASLLGLALYWPSLWLLLPAMVLFGALGSIFDVAINAEGTTLESLGGRAVMSQLHGMFSLGGMAGAALGAALLRAGMAPALQLALLGLTVASSVLLNLRGMLPASAHHQADAPPALLDTPLGTLAEPPARRRSPWPHGALLFIGLLIFCGMTAEGVMYDWSVLYLKDALHQPQDRAALAYAVFSAAMAATRFAGDALRERWPQTQLLRGGALLAGSAMLLVLLVAQPLVALLGFVLVGMGLALVVPMLYNAATHVPGTQRASAIAAVSSIGYAGFLLGPPLIGGIAHALNLTAAMGVVVLACAALAWGTGRVPGLGAIGARQPKLRPT
jgi:predicted MFS family arabinose efflux permease